MRNGIDIKGWAGKDDIRGSEKGKKASIGIRWLQETKELSPSCEDNSFVLGYTKLLT